MLKAYRLATKVAEPLLPLYLRLRLRRGKEDAVRLKERLGHARLTRPKGKKLLWVHAASVGEANSVLPLLLAFQERYPSWWIMVTTGTVTSAALMKERLPAGAFHQYIPLDAPRAVARFLAHWQPDAAWWVESELWPNLLFSAKEAAIPLALINARMSEKSAHGWRRFPCSIARLLGCFRLILAQSEADAERFRRLGADGVRYAGNLKFDAPALPADKISLEAFERQIGSRPCWLAASLHPGEVEAIVDTHVQLSDSYPGLLTIIVPRHPEKGSAMQEACAAKSIPAALRSAGENMESAAVYIADSLGELGLFYRLSPIAFIGGSLIEHGGQNPLEAARLGCAIVMGKHMFNFAESVAALLACNGALQMDGAAALSFHIDRLLRDPMTREGMAGRAKEWTESQRGGMQRVLEAVTPLLKEKS